MRFLIALGHPAHYHLFKNVSKGLVGMGHDVRFAIREKDVLRRLLDLDGVEYYLLGHSSNGLIQNKSVQYLARIRGLVKIIRDFRPNLIMGTNGEVAHAGFLLGVPNLLLTEDDQHITPLYAKTCFPFTRNLVAPDQCSLGRWEHKGIKYPSYHELAYLHPNHFSPDSAIVEKYFSAAKPYFILRFVQLNAHHDKGIRGIGIELAVKIVDLLKQRGDVHITAERKLEPELEPYRIQIAPIHMHHVLGFAQLFIGDSQTMAAEAGVMGTPYIRFNDFVGRIGYLNDIENNYGLGFGIPASSPDLLIKTLEGMLLNPDLKSEHLAKREKLLNDKIDAAKFLTWLFANYPQSLREWKYNPGIADEFR